MKHLTILLTMAISFTGVGQQMPYNPDANGDDFVGVGDVLGVLGVYDTALIQPDLTCDYDGTDLENLLAGLFNGELVLDSMYVEYLFVDTQIVYTPGCPDPVLMETVLNRSYMYSNITTNLNTNVFRISSNLYPFLGFNRMFELSYQILNGTFEVMIRDFEVDEFMGYHFQCQFQHTIPFPETTFLDEDGIQAQSWSTTSGAIYNSPWTMGAQNFRLIPFWHEAE